MAKEKKVWRLPSGTVVPFEGISAINKKREKVVDKLVTEAVKINNNSLVFRNLAFKLICDFLGQESDYFNLTPKQREEVTKNWKGNKTLTNYEGTLKVEVRVKGLIEYTTALDAAKAIIDSVIERWIGEGVARKELIVTVQALLQTNKKGHYNRQNILMLRDLTTRDREFQKAQKILSECERVLESKSYIGVYIRDPQDRAWIKVPMQVSSAKELPGYELKKAKKKA